MSKEIPALVVYLVVSLAELSCFYWPILITLLPLDNPLPQAFIEEHDRVDTLSGACQAGNADGDDPAWQTGVSKPAEVP